MADAAYELGPTDDNQPFFFKLDPGLPQAIQQALIVSVVLALVLLLVGFVQPAPNRQRNQVQLGIGGWCSPRWHCSVRVLCSLRCH